MSEELSVPESAITKATFLDGPKYGESVEGVFIEGFEYTYDDVVYVCGFTDGAGFWLAQRNRGEEIIASFAPSVYF